MRWSAVAFLLYATAALGAPRAELWPRWEAHEPGSTHSVDHSAWDDFLAKYVVADHPSGVHRVRYRDVVADDRAALGRYLDTLQGTVVSGLNRLEQKAYWINLYNALTVKLILDHYPVASIRAIDISPGWFADGPWRAKLATVEGVPLSLDDIEHRILRPLWEDNRVHYAVNCASVGCPNLQPAAFRGENTERLLEQAAREYVNHPRGVDVTDGVLRLSSIYDWFESDFGGSRAGVIAHLLRYADEPLRSRLAGADGKTRYSYDWSLNQ